jgi:hypothetical protein
MHDAGAKHVFDFVDGGYPSTYLCPLDELLDLHRLLLAHAAAQEAHWVVLEVADGLLQRESDALLHSSIFTDSIEAWAFAASESMAAVAGVELLRSCGVEPLVVSGVISMSPLSMREASEKTGVPCLTGAQIQNGALNDRLLGRVQTTVPAAR